MQFFLLNYCKCKQCDEKIRQQQQCIDEIYKDGQLFTYMLTFVNKSGILFQSVLSSAFRFSSILFIMALSHPKYLTTLTLFNSSPMTPILSSAHFVTFRWMSGNRIKSNVGKGIEMAMKANPTTADHPSKV